jgi:hypothetical protein
MKNFTGQKFGIILKDWTSVIKLKNSNGNATITLFTPKVLRKMNLSNGRCHLCKESNIQEDLQPTFLVQILKSVSIYYKVHSD